MLAISTVWSFPRSGTLAQAVDDVAALEFEAVELRANGAVPDHVDGARHCSEIRMKCPSVFAPLDPRPWSADNPTLGLALTDDTRRRVAVNAALTTLPAAAAAGARVIVLRLGAVDIDAGDPDIGEPDLERRREHRDAHLDAAARSLFELTRAESGVVWSITTPRTWLEMPDPEEVELLISDAGRRNVAYTHDVASAHRLGEIGAADPQSWLERAGDVTSGVVFSDRVGEQEGLPPGAGSVDWPAVAAQVGSGMLRTLLVGPRHTSAELIAGAGHIRGLGIA